MQFREFFSSQHEIWHACQPGYTQIKLLLKKQFAMFSGGKNLKIIFFFKYLRDEVYKFKIL